jgi:hypothetical protein
VYLACLLYYEDKVLVSNEDFLPVIEVDENHPSSIHPDFHWLMKVTCTLFSSVENLIMTVIHLAGCVHMG